MRGGAALLLVAIGACQPSPSVVRVGDLTVLLHLPPDQTPLSGLVALNLRVLDAAGDEIAQRHFAPDDPIDFEVQHVGGSVEVVLEGYRDRDTMVARGATGLVASNGPRQVGLYFGLRQRFGAVPSAVQPTPGAHAAVALADGRVLIAGGRTAAAATDQVWRYDPVTAQFEAAGTLSTARSAIAAAALVDGRVVLVGGFDQSGVPVAAAEVHEPASDTLGTLGTPISAIGGACAVTLPGGQVAVAGGVAASGASTALLVFDSSLAAPAVHALTPPGRHRHACAPIGSGLVAIGGAADASVSAAHFDDGISESLALPVPIGDGAAFVAGSQVGVLCGNDRQPQAVVLTPSGSAALTSDRWQLALARTACSATLLRDGTLLVIGGRSGGRDILQAEVLRDDGTATPVDALIEPRIEHSATRLPGGEVLVVGGDGEPPRLYVP